MRAAADVELVRKCKKTAEKGSEIVYMMGNEPTLACYRIQEHVHKSGPMLIDKGTEMKKLKKNLQKCCYGIDYSIKTLRAMDDSISHFQNIEEHLKNALFMKQQLDYEASVKARVRAKQQQSLGPPSGKKTAFQRFSGSFDIPAALITSSLSGISNSASADLKELKNALSHQFKGQAGPSSAPEPPAASTRKESTEVTIASEALDQMPSTSRSDSTES